MSDTQSYEEVAVSAEGVTVLKRFEAEEFPVPAIAFEFVSERAEPVMIRIEDTVPDAVAVEDLGFHPEYGSEHWTVEDETITFEKELDGDSTYTTVYGIRATGTDDIERFLTEPTIDHVDPPLSEGELVEDGPVPDSDDAVREAIAGDGDVPGLDDGADDEEEDDEEEIETIELNDPTGDSGSDAGTTDPDPDPEPAADSGPPSPDTDVDLDGDLGADSDAGADLEPAEGMENGDEEAVSAPVSGEGSLVAAMAEELRDKEVSAEDVKTLRRALELAGEEGGSVDARLDRIQGDVADLRAYTDALEEFLDENGTGEQLIEDARRQLDEFEETVEEMESRIDAAEGTAETAEAEVGEVRAEVDDIGATVDDVEDSVGELEAALDSVETDLEEVRESMAGEEALDRLDDLESEVSELQEWQTQIKETFGG